MNNCFSMHIRQAGNGANYILRTLIIVLLFCQQIFTISPNSIRLLSYGDETSKSIPILKSLSIY